MQIAGYLDFTKRDLRNYTRVLRGYLPVDVYAREILARYRGVHNHGVTPSSLPENHVSTRDPAILHTVEQKIYPARLIWEFQFGPQLVFSAMDLVDLNDRLFSDIYCQAGCIRSSVNIQDIQIVLNRYSQELRGVIPDAVNVGPAFGSMLAELLSLNIFYIGNLFTTMVFCAKIAAFWGYQMRFLPDGGNTCLCYSMSDRKSSATGVIRLDNLQSA